MKYTIKNKNNNVVYTGEDLSKAPERYLTNKRYTITDEDDNTVNPEDIVNDDTIKVENNIPVKEEIVDMKITTTESVIIDFDSVVRLRPTESAPAVKVSNVDEEEKQFLKYNNPSVMTVFSANSNITYTEKNDDWYHCKSGWFKK